MTRIFRFSKLDSILVGAALAQGVGLCLGAMTFGTSPWTPLGSGTATLAIATGVWWGSNTISHIHLHNPLFVDSRTNRLFSAYLSALLGVPQALWRERHLRHHMGGPTHRKGRRPSARALFEAVLVLTTWGALLALSPVFFFSVYLPGYLLGLILCQIQGHYEHAGAPALPGISYYGRFYNLLWFNDGYHAEHHLHPGEHWSRLAERSTSPTACASPLPPVLRFLSPAIHTLSRASLNRLQARSLVWLERFALRKGRIQRLVLRSHDRALRKLLAQVGGRPPARVAIVGGGLFPRSALLLQAILPEAELTIFDSSEESLQIAREQLESFGVAPERVGFLHETYVHGTRGGFDLVVIPLGYVGDREGLYSGGDPSQRLIVHDWIWRRRGISSVVVSWLLLKRMNLVLGSRAH